MLVPSLIPLFAVLTVAQNISFINPGPAGSDSTYNDDPSFAYGSNMVIQWTPTSSNISIVLYQQTQNAAFEYVFQNQAGFSSYNWKIATTKSLDVSRIFFFEIFIQGQTGSAASSHYFNITGNAPNAVTSVTPLYTSSPATSIHTSATAVTAGSSSTAKAASSTASAASTSSPGLSTGAKVAIGVAVPVAVIAGLLAGWFVFGRRRKANKIEETQHAQWQPVTHEYYEQGNMQPYDEQGNIQPYQGPMVMEKPQELDSRRANVPTHELES